MEQLQRELIVIPATKNIYAFGSANRRLRVASYSRVSTDFEEQLTSFYAQKSYYTDLIMRTPEWQLAGTYADEGISGASIEKRPDFMRMLKHCKKGKIDLIITKSISRFARNTVDSIKTVRMLKAMGVGVLFEKEGINTLEENSEVVLTILSSLAQEELNSLSLNIKMGKRMAMQEGRFNFRYKNSYAYRKGADGEPEIIPKEAVIIKLIYTQFLSGKSVNAITKLLNEKNMKSHAKGGKWIDSTIQSILENEKYCGDVLLQKTYVIDPITKKTRKNNGELPKYLIRNNHPAIVSRETYDKVQEEKARRGSKRKVSKQSKTELSRYSGLYALNEKLICGECLSPYRRVVWRKRNGDPNPVWRCISRVDYGTKYCEESPTLDEESLHLAIMNAINATRGSRQKMIPIFLKQLKQSYIEQQSGATDITKVEAQITELKNSTMALVQESVLSNTVYENELRLKAMSDEIKALSNIISEYKNSQGSQFGIEKTISDLDYLLQNEPDESEEYDDNLVRQLIDTIKVAGDNLLIVAFKCGIIYEQPLTLKVRRLRKAA